jgi:hypothetical protein
MRHRCSIVLFVWAAALSAGMSAVVLCSLVIGAQPCEGEILKPETAAAFENYIRSKEALANRELSDKKTFLEVDGLSESDRRQAYAALRQGRIITQRDETACGPAACPEAPGGLIHDWVGIVFVPGVSLSQALSALQDYNRDVAYYQPEVVQSKLLASSGSEFKVFLRLKRVEVITAVFDTEYEIRYTTRDATHAYSRSHSTRIAEVEDAGKASEHDRPPGDDRGLLWRLYSYWRFYQADGGVYIQCDAVSLTRDVPAGFGWMLGPFLEQIPAESLRFTLDATRTALSARTNGALAASRKISTNDH